MIPAFSIITVTYNSAKTVEQTIRSVLSQSFDDFEYIIVDGASKDGTTRIIEKYAASDPRIRYISEPDKGIYDAMNKGIKMATGNVIGILNSDDYYEKDALKTISEAIPASNEFVVYGMIRMLLDDCEDSVLFYNHNSLPKRMIMHPACFVSKFIYEKYQYDTTYRSAADYDLFLKLYQDQEILFVPVYRVITNFRIGGMSSSSISYIEKNDIRYKYGYISKKQHDIGNVGLKIKTWLIGSP